MNNSSLVPCAEQELLFLESGQLLMGMHYVCTYVHCVPSANPEAISDGYTPLPQGIHTVNDFSS